MRRRFVRAVAAGGLAVTMLGAFAGPASASEPPRVGIQDGSVPVGGYRVHHHAAALQVEHPDGDREDVFFECTMAVEDLRKPYTTDVDCWVEQLSTNSDFEDNIFPFRGPHGATRQGFWSLYSHYDLHVCTRVLIFHNAIDPPETGPAVCTQVE